MAIRAGADGLNLGPWRRAPWAALYGAPMGGGGRRLRADRSRNHNLVRDAMGVGT